MRLLWFRSLGMCCLSCGYVFVFFCFFSFDTPVLYQRPEISFFGYATNTAASLYICTIVTVDG